MFVSFLEFISESAGGRRRHAFQLWSAGVLVRIVGLASCQLCARLAGLVFGLLACAECLVWKRHVALRLLELLLVLVLSGYLLPGEV